ncbi:hypothetical protein QBC37DRAFT_450660 [Rhypophila decipiens]|uniref:Fibronectin type-III domain-containing protein n=1 Tax=Rhypophila decipiens TaxID=261697 RepID=A0AAN6Y0V8_9PEZI|nr:hypothetical protein QBC37DRAFT_450660 [Rhypophila decipiens]
MKVLTSCLALFIFLWPAVASSGDIRPPDTPMGGKLVTDPKMLSTLMALHEDSFKKQWQDLQIPVRSHGEATHQVGSHDKRIFHLFGLGGFALVEVFGAALDLVGSWVSQIALMFQGGDDAIWDDPDYCRVDFETWAGHRGTFKTWRRGNTGGQDVTPPPPNHNIAWNNPTTTSPPVMQFWDTHLGYYSIQFTATKEVAWSGIPGTRVCLMEGICNPQYVFYRSGYTIVLNKWQSQGVVAECQYTGDCKGVCKSHIRDQFSQGGMVWGGKCAVPCKEDGGDGLPQTQLPKPKFMVVGDSISHGMEWDFTWRWRLFYWIRNVIGRDPKFVGPLTGTLGPVPERFTRPMPPLFPGEAATEDTSGILGFYHDLVPGEFRIQGQAAEWGQQAAQTKATIEAWVREHKPDYLLVLLGFNDLGWWVSGPDDLVGNMGGLVENARRGQPNITILIDNVVHRTFINGRQDLVDNTNRYNQLLRERMGSWHRWGSPLLYVDVNTNYNCRSHGGCPDAYDGLHPNAMGEYHIAQSFAQALKQHFGFIGDDFPVSPSPEPRIVSTPPNVGTPSFPEGLLTSWNIAKNNRGYIIRTRLQGMTSWWSEGPVSPNSYASWNTWVLTGQTWETQVCTRADGTDGDEPGAFIGRGAPTPSGNLNAVNIDPTTVRLTWSTSASASGYGVYVYTSAWAPHGEGTYVAGTTHSIGFLFPGTWNYRYCVTAFNGNLESSRTAVCIVPPVYPGFRKRDVAVGNGTRVANASAVYYDSRAMMADSTLQILAKQLLIKEASEDATIAVVPEETV